MNELREKISDFIFMNAEPSKSDAILCTGTSYAAIPEFAAKLYGDGIAPFIFVGGRYSITVGSFTGVKDKADIYKSNYSTEAEFYTDVLLKNGVPRDAILAEHRSTYTKENAVCARELANERGIVIRRALLVCHSFHARRAYMYYKSQFHDTELIPIGVPATGVTKENWYESDHGIECVMGEVQRIGEQFSLDELKELLR